MVTTTGNKNEYPVLQEAVVKNKYSDEAVQENARKKLREMFSWQPFAKRWEPVAKELLWALGDRADSSEHAKILPEYCYNILDLFRRTTFQVFPAMAETVLCQDKEMLAGKTIAEAKPYLSMDWEKMGAVLGIGLRSVRFFDFEAKGKIEQEGLSDLDEDQAEDLGKLLMGNNGMEELIAKIQALDPGKPIEEIIESQFAKVKENTKAGLGKFNQWAYEWGPDAMTQLNAGIAKGMSGLLDEQGELKGEKRLQLSESYWFLLVAWPEIDEMVKASPPKRMNDLWDWLEPFSHAGWIEVEDLEQLISLCRPIKLKLKSAGRPRKSK